MILTYHEVTSSPSKYVYSATTAELREHMQQIRSVSRSSEANAITFDDGHLSQFTHALPVLEQERCKAIFFVTAGWTGVKADYMTWRQLRELTTLGHTVQAHGLTHRLLTHCTPGQLIEELRGAKQRLEDGLGQQVTAVSMPGGRWDAGVIRACAEQGYRAVYTSHPYARTKRIGSTIVSGRAMVRRGMSAENLLALLRSEQNAISRPRMEFYVKHGLRTMLGDRAYHRLWSCMGRADQKQISIPSARGNSR